MTNISALLVMLDDLPYPTPMPFSFDVSNLLRLQTVKRKENLIN